MRCGVHISGQAGGGVGSACSVAEAGGTAPRAVSGRAIALGFSRQGCCGRWCGRHAGSSAAAALGSHVRLSGEGGSGFRMLGVVRIHGAYSIEGGVRVARPQGCNPGVGCCRPVGRGARAVAGAMPHVLLLPVRLQSRVVWQAQIDAVCFAPVVLRGIARPFVPWGGTRPGRTPDRRGIFAPPSNIPPPSD